MMLYHPVTQSQLERFVAQPNHALLLLGKPGSGKSYIAEEIAIQLLQLRNREELARHSFTTRLTPVKGSISVESIRNLQGFMRLKTLGVNPIRRVAIVEDANTMTTEAQNAFLKILEEPPADTILILTASSKNSLLPTTLSRTQHIAVRAPRPDDALAYFMTQGHSKNDIERILHISDRLPGMTTALLKNDTTHALLDSINEAKTILRAGTYERMLMVERLSKDRDNASLLLQAFTRVIRAVLITGLSKSQPAQNKKLVLLLRHIQRAEQQLAHNVQPKLALTNLFLHI